MKAAVLIGLAIAVTVLAPAVGALVALGLAAWMHITYRKETP